MRKREREREGGGMIPPIRGTGLEKYNIYNPRKTITLRNIKKHFKVSKISRKQKKQKNDEF